MRKFACFCAVLSFAVIPAAAQEIDVEARRKELFNEAAPELFSMKLGDTDVSLVLGGYWNASLLGNWGLSKSRIGWQIASTDTPILWTQEADLTLSLLIRENWFVEANFREDYDINTYRAGYRGNSGFVRYLGIGNTGLSFPLFPYLDMGGDSASSLGFYGEFGSGALSLHALVRYDNAVREERVFVGGYERNRISLSVGGMLRGVSFVLPDSNIQSLPVVYLEDKDGMFSGAGTRWRMARPGEAAVSAKEGLIELAESPAGMVAVVYPGGYSTGSYSGTGTFLGDVQAFFPGYNLSAYPQPGSRAGASGSGSGGGPAEIEINGKNALVIYEKGAFSPFERLGLYSAPASNVSGGILADSSSKTALSGWELYKRADESSLPALPQYVGEESATSLYMRDVYILAWTGAGEPVRRVSGRSELSRWPLGEDASGRPWLLEIYLPGKSLENGVELLWTSYSAQSGYYIGSDVLPGSVEAYRGGISDTNLSFNEGTGFVTLGTPAQLNELIRISYLKRSADRRNGSIAAAIGAVYKGESSFSAGGALGLRWNMSGEGYSEDGATSPGIAGAGGRLSWAGDRFGAEISAGIGYKQPDTTGLYRIAGMEGHETIFELPDSAFLSNPARLVSGSDLPESTRAPLVFRNYRDTNAVGSTTLRPVEWDAPVTSGVSAPYPAWDNAYNAKVMIAEYALSASQWTGFQAELPSGTAISEAEEILLPVRYYSGGAGITVTVQFGTLSKKDMAVSENPGLIVEAVPSGISGDAQIFRIRLNDADRRKLVGADGIRFIITGSGSGRVLFAPPVFRGAAFAPQTISAGKIIYPDPMPVSVVEESDPSLASKYADEINRLHRNGEKQRVLTVSWGGGNTAFSAGGAGGRIAKVPLSDYTSLSFFVKTATGISAGTFDFYILRDTGSLGKFEGTALEARIPGGEIVSGGGTGWVNIELRYAGEQTGVFIAGRKSANSYLRYNGAILRKRGSEAADLGEKEDSAFILAAASQGSGGFSIDEITLKNGAAALYAASGLRLKLDGSGILAGSQNFPVLSDGILETALEAAGNYNPAFDRGGFSGSAITRSRGEISLFGIKLSGNLAFSLSGAEYGTVSWWTAGHALSREFGPVSLREQFYIDPVGRSWTHEAGMRLSSALNASFNASSGVENTRLERGWRASADMKDIGGTTFGFTVNADWRWRTEAENTSQSVPVSHPEGNYAIAWTNSWKSLLPDDGAAASGRTMRGRLDAGWNSLPVGARFSVALTQDASKTASRTFSGIRTIFDIPWQAGVVRGSAGMERTYERSLSLSYNSAAGDLSAFADAVNDGISLIGAIPIYSLFDPEMMLKLNSAFNSADYPGNISGGGAGDRYSLTFRLPAHKGTAAFFLPYDAEFHVDRNIIRKLDTTQDVLGTGGAFNFSAINIFGAFGSTPIFKIYRNDEFRHSLSAAFAIPKNDDVSWRVRAEQNAVFYGYLGAELKINDAVTLLSSGQIFGLSAELITPAQNTLAASLFDRVMRRFDGNIRFPAFAEFSRSRYERLRKEKIRLDLDFSGSTRRTMMTAGHESIIRIAGRFSFTIFADLSFTLDNNAEYMTFLAQTGLTVNFNF